MSKSRNSIAVTMPKLPPPPRTAQNTSGLVSASARSWVPSPSTSSTAGDAVGGHPELPGVPADAAAERVADHADVGGGAVQRGQAVRARPPRRRRATARRPRRGRSGAPASIVDAGHRRGAQQHRRRRGRRAGRRCGRCPAVRRAARRRRRRGRPRRPRRRWRGRRPRRGAGRRATFQGIRAASYPGSPGRWTAPRAQPAQPGGAGCSAGGRSGGRPRNRRTRWSCVFSSIGDWPRSGRWQHSSAENLGVT